MSARLALGALALVAAGAVVLSGRVDPARVADKAVAVGLGVTVPDDLDDPRRIARGAGHYAQVCVACHASPADPRRTAALDLRPPAPVLHLRLADWPPAALFHVVRDGVPNSGMPAWPERFREDEVWDMVAFLQRLPTLDAAAYRRLTAQDAAAGATGPLRGCLRCHGAAGEGRDGIPRLDLQSPVYLAEALRAYRDRRRGSGVMQMAVAGMDDATLDALAQRFGRERRVEAEGTPPPMVLRGDPDRKVPPCAACHGLSDPVRPEFPRLMGQDAGYLARQLTHFAANGALRGGGPFHSLMAEAGHALTPEDIAEAVEWYGRAER